MRFSTHTARMSRQQLQLDIAIIGGGIAGLWTLNQLRGLGYSAVLFEQEALGSHQTIASQGMIHGGIKYALGGALSGGSETISAMPAAWRACLAGDGPVDLRGAKVLSDDFYLWSAGSLQSRMTSFFASKMLRGRVQKLQRAEFPAPLRDDAFKGQVYRLVDLVMDTPSVIETLARNCADAIFNIDWQHCSLRTEQGQALISTPETDILPRQLVLTAGVGNEALLQQLGAKAPQMQRRPLQQVLVKHEYAEPFYAHCTGTNPSPRLTVSSHTTRHGEPVWYLGGDLATENTDTAPDRLIELAKTELATLLPWVPFGKMEWQTIRLDRAEPKQSALRRPDSAYLGEVDAVSNALTAWPTKLSLSPDLGDAISNALSEKGIQPGAPVDLSPLQPLGRPTVAEACWDTLFP